MKEYLEVLKKIKANPGQYQNGKKVRGLIESCPPLATGDNVTPFGYSEETPLYMGVRLTLAGEEKLIDLKKSGFRKWFEKQPWTMISVLVMIVIAIITLLLKK